MNAATSSWMRGEAELPGELQRATGPVWSRYFAPSGADLPASDPRCRTLEAVFDEVARQRPGGRRPQRMVVGHTPQVVGGVGAVTAACGGRGVWRIDVGMSEGMYGAEPQVLEIARGNPGEGEEVAVRVIRLSSVLERERELAGEDAQDGGEAQGQGGAGGSEVHSEL